MPILTITEYGYMQSDARHAFDSIAPHSRSIVNMQTILISGASTPSIPWSPKTTFVRLNTDVACNLAYSLYSGHVPVANGSFHRLGADHTEYQGVTPGDMVAVILSPDPGGGGGGGGGGGAGWMPTFVLIDTSSAAVSYTLPATPTNNEEIIVKDNGHAEINNITVQGGSFPIDGQPTFLMRHNWASYGFWYLSGQWYVV